jgi:hypothetical protein
MRFEGVSSKFPFKIGNFTSKAGQFLRVPRSLGPLTGLLSSKGTSRSQMWSRLARGAVVNEGVAFAECKQVCARSIKSLTISVWPVCRPRAVVCSQDRPPYQTHSSIPLGSPLLRLRSFVEPLQVATSPCAF